MRFIQQYLFPDKQTQLQVNKKVIKKRPCSTNKFMGKKIPA